MKSISPESCEVFPRSFRGALASHPIRCTDPRLGGLLRGIVTGLNA
jgi:hypothetical protein